MGIKSILERRDSFVDNERQRIIKIFLKLKRMLINVLGSQGYKVYWEVVFVSVVDIQLGFVREGYICQILK